MNLRGAKKRNGKNDPEDVMKKSIEDLTEWNPREDHTERCFGRNQSFMEKTKGELMATLTCSIVSYQWYTNMFSTVALLQRQNTICYHHVLGS